MSLISGIKYSQICSCSELKMLIFLKRYKRVGRMTLSSFLANTESSLQAKHFVLLKLYTSLFGLGKQQLKSGMTLLPTSPTIPFGTWIVGCSFFFFCRQICNPLGQRNHGPSCCVLYGPKETFYRGIII